MRPGQVNKIYEDLTPYQLAVLAYESCIEFNEEESSHIRNVAEASNCCSLHTFRGRLNTITSLVSTWGIEYWQTTAGIIAFAHVICSSSQVTMNDFEGTILYHKRTALVAALRASCIETGLCIDKVLTFLSINPESFNEQDKMPDEDLNGIYVKRYLSILE